MLRLDPLIHRLSPLSWADQIMAGIERMPGSDNWKGLKTMRIMDGGDLVIKPGMVFELEPNACKGNAQVDKQMTEDYIKIDNA